MAFGWKYGTCPPVTPCAPVVSCSTDVTALWIAPAPITLIYDGYFVTPFVSGSETALIWTVDSPVTSSFS